MSEQGARDQARAEAARRYPPDHTVDDPFGATGEARSDPYGYEEYARKAFVAGADWQASRKVEVTEETVERAARAGHEYVWARRLKDYGPYESWDELDEGYREYLRGIQRAALSAALGGGEHD